MVAKWGLVGAPVVAAARGLAVDGDEVGLIRPGLADPGTESGREQGRVDAVHQNGQPAPAWQAVVVGHIAAQETEMRLPHSAMPS